MKPFEKCYHGKACAEVVNAFDALFQLRPQVLRYEMDKGIGKVDTLADLPPRKQNPE